MPFTCRRNDEARRRAAALLRQVGLELRAARHVAGVSQAVVGRAIGTAQSEVCRRELGKARAPTIGALALHASAVGLRLSVSLWPVGGAVRDAGQARYISQFVARVGRPWRVTLEAPMKKSGDLRAIDVVLQSGPLRIAVEVMTRLADLQAQVRGAQLKARDFGADRLVIAVAGTHANRRALAAVRPALVASFDLDSQRVLAELARGRDPGRDAIIAIRPNA